MVGRFVRSLELFKISHLHMLRFALQPKRKCSNAREMFDYRSKSAKIQSSIMLYLKRFHDYDKLLEIERKEFEKGRRYLAQIMGCDVNSFDQEQIDEAINYLLPSGLFSHKARPQLKPPENIFHANKKLECDMYGRPLHDMFYTRHPNYYRVMNEAALLFEDLNRRIDQVYINKEHSILKEREELLLVSTEWFTKEQFENYIEEPVSEKQYNRWLAFMQRITQHALAKLLENFINQFRTKPMLFRNEVTFPEPLIESDTNKKYIVAYGQKKHAFAEVKLYMPGFGNFSVNGKHLLEVFPELGNREQIMSPLQLTKTLGKVDITAKVSGNGSSSMANSLRLAISRSLASMLSADDGKNKLHVTGLLTQDERFSERKHPGQKKARKKPIWKAR